MSLAILRTRWNPRSTAAERFRELAMMADENPELFERVFVCWDGTDKKGELKANYTLSGGMNTRELLGLIELGKFQVLRITHGLP